MDKKTASVLLYVLHHDLTSRSKITEKFPVSDEEADSIIAELVDHGVITPFQSNNYAVITDIDDLDEEMLQILEDEGLKKEFIADIIAGKYTTQEEISNIVRYNEDDLWSMIDDNVEIPSGKLLIRIKDPNHTYINSRDSILYVEDQRMAEYKDGKWFVDPPYAKYEYSPVIGPDHQILPGMEVTYEKDSFDRVLALADDPDMQTKWRYFLKTLGNPVISFSDVMKSIQIFLEPVWIAILSESEHTQSWTGSLLCWK